MLGRKSKAAVADRSLTSAGARAVDVVGEAAVELAERAMAAAQSAQRAATPVIKTAAERSGPVLRNAAEKSAESLSHAAERAAVVLSDTAERLAESGEVRAAQAGFFARHRLADASESVAKAVRPKKRRPVRRLVALLLVGGGLVALVRSPLKSKLADRLFGAPPEFDDDEPESITLPSTTEPASTSAGEPSEPTGTGPSGESQSGTGTSAPADEEASAQNGSHEHGGVPSSASTGDEGTQA